MRAVSSPAMVPALLAACVAVLGLGGCTTGTEPSTDCPNVSTLTKPDGLLHGVACTTNADCKYGVCSTSAMQMAGATGFGVCTKNCRCGPNSQCSDDDNNTKNMTFSCIKGGAGGAVSECAARCTSAADCQAINPKLPFCVTSVSGSFSGAVKVCAGAAK